MTNIILSGTTPTLIQQSTASGYSLQNNGPGNVYLGNDASLTPSNGFKVVPGVTVPLGSGAVLWACADDAQTANVQILQGVTASSTTVVEANVPGSVAVTGNVNATITNAVVPVNGTVNANIQNASIPVTGNVGITSGSVDITSGNVTVAGQVSTRSQNLPTVLVLQTVSPIPNSMANPTTFGATIFQATAGYASLIIAVADSSTIPLSFVSMYKAQIVQTLNGKTVRTDNAHWLMGNANGFVQVPVVGDTAVITGQYINSSTGGGGGTSATFQVSGSSEVIAAPKYLSQNNSAKGSVSTGGYYETTTSAVISDFVNSRSGPAQLSVLAGGSTSTGSANLAVIDFDNPGSAIILCGTGGIPTGGAVNLPVILPMRPVYITTHPTAATLIGSLQQ